MFTDQKQGCEIEIYDARRSYDDTMYSMVDVDVRRDAVWSFIEISKFLIGGLVASKNMIGAFHFLCPSMCGHTHNSWASAVESA